MEIRGDFRTYSRYVSLNVTGMLGTSFYVLADTLFIANGIGETGIASLNLALPMFSFIQGIGFMLGVGGATWYSILRAKNKHKEATKIFNQTIILGATLGLLFVLFGLFSSETITRFFGADQQTFAMAHTYTKVIMVFAPFFIFNHMLVAFIRNDQNPKLAMFSMILGSVSNVVLDYVFIFLLDMGMLGAALATGGTPIFGLILLSFHFKSVTNNLHFIKVKIKLKSLWTIIKLGISSFVTEISSGIVMLVFNILILGITGNLGIAAYGIIANIAIISIAIFTGIAQGIQPIISHLFGANKLQELKRTFMYGMITTVLFSTLMYLVISHESDLLIGMFNRDQNPVLAEIAKMGLLIYFAGMFFAGFNIIAIASLSAMNQATIAFKFSILRSIILIIPLAFLLANSFDMTGVWASFVATEVITSCLIIWQLFRVNKSYHS